MITPRPAPDDSAPKPGFPMRPFFGIKPELVNPETVSHYSIYLFPYTFFFTLMHIYISESDSFLIVLMLGSCVRGAQCVRPPLCLSTLARDGSYNPW